MPGDGCWCSGVHGTNCSLSPLVPSVHPPFCNCIVLLPEALCGGLSGTQTLGRRLSLANVCTLLSNNAGKYGSATLELSFNWTRVLVRSWLFCIQHFPDQYVGGSCLKTVWRFEHISFYCGSLGLNSLGMLLAC